MNILNRVKIITEILNPLKINGFPEWIFSILIHPDNTDILITVTNVEDDDNQRYLTDRLISFSNIMKNDYNISVKFAISETKFIISNITLGFRLISSF